MNLLVISFLAFFSPDTCLSDSVYNKVHKDMVMDITKIKYLYPCKWSCSCNQNKIRYGWLVEYEGKTYHLEGKRRDGKKNDTMFTDYTDK